MLNTNIRPVIAVCLILLVGYGAVTAASGATATGWSKAVKVVNDDQSSSSGWIRRESVDGPDDRLISVALGLTTQPLNSLAVAVDGTTGTNDDATGPNLGLRMDINPAIDPLVLTDPTGDFAVRWSLTLDSDPSKSPSWGGTSTWIPSKYATIIVVLDGSYQEIGHVIDLVPTISPTAVDNWEFDWEATPTRATNTTNSTHGQEFSDEVVIADAPGYVSSSDPECQRAGALEWVVARAAQEQVDGTANDTDEAGVGDNEQILISSAVAASYAYFGTNICALEDGNGDGR